MSKLSGVGTRVETQAYLKKNPPKIQTKVLSSPLRQVKSATSLSSNEDNSATAQPTSNPASHEEEQLYFCCGQSHSQKNIQQHILNVHRGRVYNCCKKLHTKEDIAKHLKENHQGAQWQQDEYYAECPIEKAAAAVAVADVHPELKVIFNILFHVDTDESRYTCDPHGVKGVSRKQMVVHINTHEDHKGTFLSRDLPEEGILNILNKNTGETEGIFKETTEGSKHYKHK